MMTEMSQKVSLQSQLIKTAKKTDLLKRLLHILDQKDVDHQGLVKSEVERWTDENKTIQNL